MKNLNSPLRSPQISLRSSSCRSPSIPLSCQEEINSLPSLSKTDSDSSNTLTGEQVAAVLDKSKVINNQVKLRLKKFIANSSSMIQNLKKSSEKSRSIVVSSEYLKEIKNQQEYILGLIEQVSVLQGEIEESYTEKNPFSEEESLRKECSLDRCGIGKGNSCNCSMW
jgi:hypothetical protein